MLIRLFCAMALLAALALPAHADKLSGDVRKDFNAPKLPFVIGGIGVGGHEATGGIANLRPAMAAGAGVVMMETLTDFATVQYFGVDTVSVGVFRIWRGTFDRDAASEFATLVLVVALMIIGLERVLRGRARFGEAAGAAAGLVALAGTTSGATGGAVTQVDSFIPEDWFLQRPGLLLGFAGAFLMLLGLLVLTFAGFGIATVFGGLVLFFAGFNFLEAGLPARLSLVADDESRGASLGLFASSQFLGAFVGGLIGGRFMATGRPADVFFVCVLLAAIWLAMQSFGRFRSA